MCRRAAVPGGRSRAIVVWSMAEGLPFERLVSSGTAELRRRAGPRAAARRCSGPMRATTSTSWRGRWFRAAARRRASPSRASCSIAMHASTPDERLRFFAFLATQMQPDAERCDRRGAGASRRSRPTPASPSCSGRWKARASEFFRRLNLAPGATAEIVAMRRDLLRMPPAIRRSPPSTAICATCCASWFNRGFLVLRRIDWQTPAAILEKIIAYEAVHEIQGWDDLRRRLDPADRRCFAFFHPSLVDEPLIFVEVALMRDMPDAIEPVLRGGAQARRCRASRRRRRCSIRSPTARRACAASRSATS